MLTDGHTVLSKCKMKRNCPVHCLSNTFISVINLASSLSFDDHESSTAACHKLNMKSHPALLEGEEMYSLVLFMKLSCHRLSS